MSKNKPRLTEQAEAALVEFGFDLVEAGQPGGPSIGRVTDRIDEAILRLDQALRERSWRGVSVAKHELRRLVLALDTWGQVMMQRAAEGDGPAAG